jgi:EAL domain-containing protein (putative c-di-GMP-specific phosphodiesterase class I)/GGDEF domain-containing protein
MKDAQKPNAKPHLKHGLAEVIAAIDTELLLARAQSRGFAVMAISIDQIANLVLNLGAVAARQAMLACARILHLELPDDIRVLCIGSDRLIVVLPRVSSEQESSYLSSRAIAALDRGVALDSAINYWPGPCIGVSLCPHQIDSAEDILSAALQALDRARKVGCGSVQSGQATQRSTEPSRMTLGADLVDALDRDELLLHYHPQIHAKTRRILGVEALMRWNHPVYGLLRPDKFIPIAQETGLIKQLSRWLLWAACIDLVKWSKRRHPPGKLSINIPPSILAEENASSWILSVVRRHEIDPSRIEIEMTESAQPIDNIERCSMNLKVLQRAGISIAIDDFGVAYPSLSQLQELPADRLKLDRSLISGIVDVPAARAILQGVLQVAELLKLAVTAEGVSTEQQLDILRQLGCESVQGHLFGEPIGFEELADFMDSTGAYALAGGDHNRPAAGSKALSGFV